MEGTYEYELERAELLGVEPISKELWEEQAKARREAEQEQEQAEAAEALATEDETIKATHGKMEELNSILASTQMKINKFKTVCGSFTSLLRIRTGSPAPPEDRASSSNGNALSSSINDALENLDQLKENEAKNEAMSDIQFTKEEVEDVGRQVKKNMNALDNLLANTEKAELSLNRQNEQIKKHLRK